MVEAEYDIDVDVSRDKEGDIDNIAVSMSGNKAPRNPEFDYNANNGKAWVSNIQGIEGMEITYIGQPAAAADAAVVERVPDVTEVSSVIDQIVKNDPNREQSEG